MKDPVDTELVQAPALLLTQIVRKGEAFGDCDDAAGLIGALDQSIGIPMGLVIGSFLPTRQLHHVWAQAKLARAPVVQDPFRAERFNVPPTRLVYRDV
jgi:transglutaminase-like putative cysteine protease